MLEMLLSFFYSVYSFLFPVASKVIKSVKNVSRKESQASSKKERVFSEASSTKSVKSSLLMEKLDLISPQLFESKQKSVMPAHYQLESGILAMRHDEPEAALRFFKDALSLADDSFDESNSFRERALTTRLKVFCILFINQFYGLGGYGKKDYVAVECTRVMNELVETDDVQKALKTEFEPKRRFSSATLTSNCPINQSPKILSEVSSIIYFIEELTQFQYNIPSQRNSEECIPLYNVQAKLKGHKKQVTCMVENGRYLFTGSKDETIKVWEIGSLTLKATLKGHRSALTCLAVMDDVLYSGAMDGGIKCWSIETLKEKLQSPKACRHKAEDYAVRSLAVHRGSNSVFAGCSDNLIRVLDSQTLLTKNTLEGHTGTVTCLAVTDRVLCSGSADATIRVWDINTNELEEVLRSHTDLISSMVVSGDRLYSGSHDKTVRVWDLLSLFEITLHDIEQIQCCVRSLAVSPCKKLYIGYSSDTIRVISLVAREDVCNIQAKPTSFDNCMTVSDGKLFIASAGKTIHVHLL